MKWPEKATKLSVILLSNKITNVVINIFLLVGYEFMSELHLKLSGFMINACEKLIKIKERIQNFKERRNYKYIHRKELDKACFYYHIALGTYKDLARRKASCKILLLEPLELDIIHSLIEMKENLLQ